MKAENSPSPARSSETLVDEGVFGRPHFYPMPSYTLSSHIHAACLNGIYVLLDEEADRYFCLSEPQSALLADILAGGAKPETCRFAASLAVRRILVPGLPAPQRRQPPTQTTSSAYRSTPAGSLRPAEWAAALRVLQTARRLQTSSLAENLTALRRDKARLRLGDFASAEIVGAAAARFTALCDLFLTRTDACLVRSLLLARYLLRRRIPADLTLGVRLGPFAAHAWVECGGSVVNDHLETVQAYTPILSV